MMKKFLACSAALAALLTTGAFADNHPVSEQITDMAMRTNAPGFAPSGRPWHTDNFVLRNEFRGGQMDDMGPGDGAIVDAMPTPVNGAVTDVSEPTMVNGQVTDVAAPTEVNGAIIDTASDLVDGPVDTSHPAEDLATTMKTPGVYASEEDDVPPNRRTPGVYDALPEVAPTESDPRAAVDDADVHLNLENHSNDEDDGGVEIFHHDEPAEPGTE